MNSLFHESSDEAGVVGHVVIFLFSFISEWFQCLDPHHFHDVCWIRIFYPELNLYGYS